MTRQLGLYLALAGLALAGCSNDPPVVGEADTGAARDAASPGLDAADEALADTGVPLPDAGSTADTGTAPSPDTGTGPGVDVGNEPVDAAVQPGPDAGDPPGADAGQPGPDAAQPGADAAQPGADAQAGLDASSRGDTGPAVATTADLRADNNRNGSIDLDDPSEDQDEDTWNASHGAIFLANIDDDQSLCHATMNTSDSIISKCHDGYDSVVNGPNDLLDLARLKTVPWPIAPADAHGTISLSSPGATYVRLFINQGSNNFVVFDPAADSLSASQIREGVELAIEGKDVVRNSTTWDGYVDVSFTVSGTGIGSPTDKVRMRVAPMITRHHLDPPQRLYASFFSDPASTDFTGDLQTAMNAAGIATPLFDLNVEDQWAQDLFETAYMSMPAVGGMQSIHVNIRSANSGRPSARVVFVRLRGPDNAAIQQSSGGSSADTLNSFGNTETIPPYTLNGVSYPLGRLFRGKTASYYPNVGMTTMFESQKVQPAVYVDTEFLLVGHVDETITFLRANTRRGWTIAVADPALARSMLQDQKNAGLGATRMFVGKQWYDGSSAAVTITNLLADTDIMAASATAAAGIAAQLTIIKAETGITDAEILHLPILFEEVEGQMLAHMVGTANGISLGDAHYGMPDPHGPIINGADLFKTQAVTEFGKVNVTIHWIEDWDLYHALDGEAHCGSNTTRVIPTNVRWWESGR